MSGYLLKDTTSSDLINAIRLVYNGEGVFTLEAIHNIIHTLGTMRYKESFGISELHGRELEVLKLAAMGMTNKDIASRLNISEHTVGSHFVNIFRKIAVESRTEAVLYGLKRGWFSLDELAPK